MRKTIIAIIPAAGVGSRMQQDKPKQYLLLQGKTILEHSLTPFLNHPHVEKVFVALAKNDPYIADLHLEQQTKIELVEGGATRAQSVLNALQYAEKQYPNAWVLVHDAARPCLQSAEINTLIQQENSVGAILALPATDTIKRANSQNLIQKTEERRQIWLAQTPQYFPLPILKQALLQAFQQGQEVTDEASAIELYGEQPRLIVGGRHNIKVTHLEDLALAEFFLVQNQKK